MSEWHKKLEDTRLLEMRQSRELGAQREEIKYLKNIVAEQERTISGLEEELVQQNNVRIAFKHLPYFYSIQSMLHSWFLILFDIIVLASRGAATDLGSERSAIGAPTRHLWETAEWSLKYSSEGAINTDSWQIWQMFFTVYWTTV